MSVARLNLPFASRFRGSLAITVAVVFVACAVFGYLALNSYFVANAAKRTPQQAQFFASSIDDALTRLRHLPFVIASEQITLDALRSGDATLLNPRLADIANRSGAEFVYLLDINGQTIASSNYEAADSLVGNYYTFRPYFLEALNGDEGLFYAVGVTTGRPGYFISQPVSSADGTIHGVVAVKIGFAELSRALSDSGALVLVSDRQGVVITSSDAALIYGHLSPLSAFDRRSLEEQQQFGDQTLFPLDWTPQSANRAVLNGTQYIWTQADLENEDWTLHLLSDVGDIRRQAILYVAIGALAGLTLIVAAAIYRASQLRRALAVSNADRSRLTAEIDERKRAEQRLEAARAALAQKNQLETLGRLSVSITHELGQPISAMRNYLVADEIATGAKPGEGRPELTGLVDRMQRLLDQLRSFGRQGTTPPQVRFVVQDALKSALALVRHSADEDHIQIEVKLPTVALELGGDVDRFEQVIVNLLRNAIDACAEVGNERVMLVLSETDDAVTVSVTDNGPGVGDLDISQLREPFFSTKASGKGMGLGLAISGQIVEEMGGSLTAHNGADGGACFTLTFPKRGT